MLKRPIKGFTLMELLIAILIVSVLAIIALPSLLDLIQANRVKAASEKLYQDIFYARSEAVKQNKNVFLTFQTGTTWCYGISTDAACNCTLAASCNLRRVTSADFNGVSMNTSGIGGGSVWFEGARGIAEEAGTIGFTIAGKTVDVSLARMGRVEICSDDIGGYQSC